MSQFRGIPVITSGGKYTTTQGFSAIKNGVKTNPVRREAGSHPKPPWLRAKFPSGRMFQQVRATVREHRLSTVCEESMCPNIGECWNNGTATLMLMGAVCTRACQFCAVDTGNPGGWLDAEEPQHAARSVQLMGLKYVVLTSVDRDDLADGGAAHYSACVRAIKELNPTTAVEALTPDFGGCLEHVDIVVDSGIEVFAQNLETVARLTHPVRDPRAGYQQTLDVLAHAKDRRGDLLTKTSLMLGLGETDREIRQALKDMRRAGVDIVTLGQYLQPTVNHLAVERFVTPDQFEAHRRWGLELGFIEVVAGPLVRSSYRADQVLQQNNVGL
jgi:lipoic acid synthetase